MSLKRETNVPNYSLSKQDLVDRLYYPDDGYRQFAPLPSEFDSNGMLIADDYLDRALTENPELNKLLASNEPIDTPTFSEIGKTGLKYTWEALGDARRILADATVTQLMGVGENPDADYISQEEYQKRKLMGMQDEDIWPHLADRKNRTYGDWVDYLGKNLGVLNSDDPDDFKNQWTSWNPANEGFGPDAKQRLNKRAQWYSLGGEVNKDGNWVNPDGSFAKLNTTWTPVEWNSRKKYEERKEKGTYWSDGILKSMKQELLYEFAEPYTDKGMEIVLDNRMKKANDPAVQALQKWSNSLAWGDISTGEELTKKVFNAIMGGAPSVVSGVAVGIGAQAIFRRPGLSTNLAATVMAAMDSSEMYNSTYDWAISEGYSAFEAENIASEYFFMYGAASMAWERLPLSKIFRRVKNVPERRRIIRSIYDSKMKKTMIGLKEELINMGPIAASKLRAIMGQGAAEAITELGQYSTQAAIEAGYKDEGFFDVADINEALDAVVGGFGLGGAMGSFGGKPIDDTKGGGLSRTMFGQKPAGSKPITNLGKSVLSGMSTMFTKTPKTKTQTVGVGGASPITQTVDSDVETDVDSDLSIPKNSSEYFEQIINQDKNDTTLNPRLVTKIKAANAPQTTLSKTIFKHQRDEFENYPIRKIADLVEKEGYGFIDNSNATQADKDSYKAQVAQELLRQKKAPFENKAELNVQEQKQLDRLNNIDIDAAIGAIENKNFDNFIDKSLDKKIEADIDKKIEQQIQAGTGGGIAITPEMKKSATKMTAEPKKVSTPVDIDNITPPGAIEIPTDAERTKVETVAVGADKDVDSVDKPQEKTTKFTPENITSLKENEVFVFGSNRAGRHGAGAALTAKNKFGAIQGQGEGLQGQTYALPTKGKKLQNLNIQNISKNIDTFLKVAKENSDKTFYLTKIATGLGNKTVEQMAELISKKNIPNNVILPKEFAEFTPSKTKAAKKKQEKNIITQPKSIDLGSELGSKLGDILGVAGVENVSELGKEQTGENLTTEESDVIKQEVKDNEAKLKDINCINKKG